CYLGEAGNTLVPAVPRTAAPTAGGIGSTHPFLGRLWRSPLLSETLWEITLGLGSHPLLGEHRVFGLPVMPAAGYVSLLLAAAARQAPGQAIELNDISLPK